MCRDQTILRRLWATFYAFWLVQVVLRLFSLGRADAFGFAAVNKLDWYLFHAVAFDWLWYLPIALIIGLPWLFGFSAKSAFSLWTERGVRLLFSLLLLLTVVDQELFRFMSMHFSRSMMQTYGNVASTRELFGMIGADRSLPWLPLVLFFGAVPLYLFLERAIRPKIRSLRFHAIVVVVVSLLFWSYTQWIWGGTFRERRLAPVVKVLLFSGETRDIALSAEEQGQLAEEYREEWLSVQGDSLWVFDDDLTYPYRRMTRQERCALQHEERCDIDGDGDGFPLREDPDDWNPDLVPGDQGEPWNFVIAILESHRAVNSGLFLGRGSWAAGTPLLDSLAQEGMHWSRLSVGGIPTIGALASIHLGMPDYPHRHIISSLTQLRATSFVELFRAQGYQTHFFSSADPVWDNQVPWLNRWYDRWHYDRSREEDQKMFAHSARWAIDSLDHTKPFLLTWMTKTNHYPFNRVEGMEPYSDTLTLQDRMLRTMRYTEEGLSEALHHLDSAGLLKRTVVVVLADHGFSLGLRPEEHGSGQIGNGLFSEHTWVPLVITGEHPRLQKGLRHDEPAGQSDLGPTILDLAGITSPNSFTGHSLLRPSGKEESAVYLFRGTEAMMEWRRWRVHGGWSGDGRELGDALYDGIDDPNQLNDLSDKHLALRDSLLNIAANRGRLHAWTIEQNRVLMP